jgi:hypothetical protein
MDATAARGRVARVSVVLAADINFGRVTFTGHFTREVPAALTNPAYMTVARYYIDVTSGVPPKHFVRGEWFVGVALLTGDDGGPPPAGAA